MTHGSLFSGIGGFDLAAQWMGWENVFHCEWNEFGKTVLKHYWPNSISYHDITKQISLFTREQSTSSAEAFHASHTPPPGSDSERRTSAIFGPKCLG